MSKKNAPNRRSPVSFKRIVSQGALGIVCVSLISFIAWKLKYPFEVRQYAPDRTYAECLSQDDAITFAHFYEAVDKGSRRLLYTIEDPTTLPLPPDENSPKVNLGDSRLLDVEIEGSTPFRNIFWLGYLWHAPDGTIDQVRDSHQRLRASNFPSLSDPLDSYVDTFANAVPRRNALAMRPSLQIIHPQSSAPDRISIYGKTLTSSAVRNGVTLSNFDIASRTVENCLSAIRTSIAYPSLEATEIVTRGSKFSIKDVQAVYSITPSHQIKEWATSAEFAIGSMAPNVVAYRTRSHGFRTLSFHDSDLLEVNFDTDLSALTVTVYDYHYQERASFGSRKYPDSAGRRQHVNLGVPNAIPADAIALTLAASDVLSFPLLQPGGRLATFTISEHADYVGIKQDRVSMYGNREGKLIEGQGLLGRGIPITKSVFPAGIFFSPMVLPLGTTGRSAPLMLATVRDTPGFFEFLEGFSAVGADVEIAVHCAGNPQKTSDKNRKNLSTLLSHLKKFKPVTWIDHGGEECLWETGWDPESTFYILPALKEHGFRYLNALGDKFQAPSNLIADGEASNLLFYLPKFDDDWQDDWHPYFYNTLAATFTENSFTSDQLRSLIDQRAYVNTHAYLSYNLLDSTLLEDGTYEIILAPWVSERLDTIKELADKKLLYLATNRTILDYMLKVRDLEVFFDGNRIAAIGDDPLAIFGDINRDTGPTIAVVPLTDRARKALGKSEADVLSLDNADKTLRFERDGVRYQILTDSKQLRAVATPKVIGHLMNDKACRQSARGSLQSCEKNLD